MGSCGLCGKDVERPFQLTHCEHTFCEKCLADCIQQTRKEEDLDATLSSVNEQAPSPLVCP
jgi:hypothetical protein